MNARRVKPGHIADEDWLPPEIDATHAACLAAADAKSDREQASAGGDFVKLEKIADRRRLARFACSELKKDCTRGYYSLTCQAALSSQKKGSQ